MRMYLYVLKSLNFCQFFKQFMSYVRMYVDVLKKYQFLSILQAIQVQRFFYASKWHKTLLWWNQNGASFYLPLYIAVGINHALLALQLILIHAEKGPPFECEQSRACPENRGTRVTRWNIFQSKNPNLGIFWRDLYKMEDVAILYGQLV
jgi:hypothetical protein